MLAGNEALKRQRAAIVRDLKHRERLMVEEMAARAREAELANVAVRAWLCVRCVRCVRCALSECIGARSKGCGGRARVTLRGFSEPCA